MLTTRRLHWRTNHSFSLLGCRPTVASSSSVAGSRGGGNLAGAGAGAASGSVSRNPQFGSLWVGGVLARRDQKLAFAAKSAEVQKGAEDMALSHKYTQTSLRRSIVLTSSNMPTIHCLHHHWVDVFDFQVDYSTCHCSSEMWASMSEKWGNQRCGQACSRSGGIKGLF